MGFKVEGRTEIVLDFSDLPALAGLRVRCRSVSTAEVQRIDQLTGEEQYRALMGDVVLEWNLEAEDGSPLALTPEALKTQEPWVGQSIYQAWQRGLYTPPSPLSEPSKNGAT